MVLRNSNNIVIVRGGGDLATGTICRLSSCGFRVLVLETAQPCAIRRTVSLCEAMYQKTAIVEDVVAEAVDSLDEAHTCWSRGHVPVMIDPNMDVLRHLHPLALVDAILAKRNTGVTREMAEVTIGLGPGFFAGRDVDAVIETMRGHDLGRVIYHGEAKPNTGVPGEIAGISAERVIHAPTEGTCCVVRDIGSMVKKGELLARLGAEPILAPINGIVRGMIRNGFCVKKGLKIADIDPRTHNRHACETISDKARAISGGVLEAILKLNGLRI